MGPGQARGVREARDAEVGEHRVHLAVALVEQHVGGLQVAVHDTVRVARGQRVRDLRGEQRGGDRGERAVLAEVAVQVGAVDQVHHQGEEIALDDEVAGAHDVRVGEPQQHRALTQEPHDDIRVVGELLLEHLDRNGLAGLPGDGRLGARGLPLAGSPDGARGAASERLLEQVLAAYRPHVMRSLLVVVLAVPRARPDVFRPTLMPPYGATAGRPPVVLPLCQREDAHSEELVAERVCNTSPAGPSRHFCTHTRRFKITKRSPPGVLSVAGARMPAAQNRGVRSLTFRDDLNRTTRPCRVGGITGLLPCRAPRAEGTADGDADPADRPRAAQRPEPGARLRRARDRPGRRRPSPPSPPAWPRRSAAPRARRAAARPCCTPGASGSTPSAAPSASRP